MPRPEFCPSLVRLVSSPWTPVGCRRYRNSGTAIVRLSDSPAVSPLLLWHQGWNHWGAIRRRISDRCLYFSYSFVQLTRSLANGQSPESTCARFFLFLFQYTPNRLLFAARKQVHIACYHITPRLQMRQKPENGNKTMTAMHLTPYVSILERQNLETTKKWQPHI